MSCFYKNNCSARATKKIIKRSSYRTVMGYLTIFEGKGIRQGKTSKKTYLPGDLMQERRKFDLRYFWRSPCRSAQYDSLRSDKGDRAARKVR